MAEELKTEANEHFKNGEYEEAVDLYTQAIEAAEEESAIYYANRVAAYIKLNKYNKGYIDSQKAISIDPNYIKAHIRMGTCAKHLGKLFEAKRALHTVTDKQPTCRQAREELEQIELIERLMAKAEELLQQNSAKQAMLYINKAMTIATDSIPIQLLKAKALLQTKEFGALYKLTTAILRDEPNNATALYYRGMHFYYQNKLPLSINHFKKALGCDPDHKDAMKQFKQAKKLETIKEKGTSLFGDGDIQGAIDSWTEGLLIDPSFDSYNSALYGNRAAAYIKLGKYDEAIADCTEAIDRNEDYVKALKRRSTCYKHQEKYEEAKRDLESCVRINPSLKKSLSPDIRELTKLIKMQKRKDYYKILNIPKTATDHEIAKAYKKQARVWHPDRHQSDKQEEATAKFKDVGEAYAVLKDPKKRRRYDSGADLEELEMPDIDVNDIFASMFGGGGFGGGNPFGGGGVRFSHGGGGGGGFGGSPFG